MPCSVILSRHVGIARSWRNQDHSSRHQGRQQCKNKGGTHSKNNRIGGTDAVLFCIEAFEESL